MTTRRILILGMLIVGHAMAQTRPAPPMVDALEADALALDAPAVKALTVYVPTKPELVAADIGRLVILHSTGSGGADSTRATGWPTVSRRRVRTGRNRRCSTNC